MNWAFDNFGIMQYTKGALSVDLEEEDCCQQSRADFFQKSTMELRVMNPSQPHGCRKDNDSQNHVDTVLPFNYTMIEDWAN